MKTITEKAEEFVKTRVHQEYSGEYKLGVYDGYLNGGRDQLDCDVKKLKRLLKGYSGFEIDSELIDAVVEKMYIVTDDQL